MLIYSLYSGKLLIINLESCETKEINMIVSEKDKVIWEKYLKQYMYDRIFAGVNYENSFINLEFLINVIS